MQDCDGAGTLAEAADFQLLIHDQEPGEVTGLRPLSMTVLA